MPNFSDMTSQQVADYLKTVIIMEGKAPKVFVPKNEGVGPKLPIYGVNSTDLPEPMARLVNQILMSEQVFDVPSTVEANTTLAPHTPGKMRSYHANNDLWLPPANVTKCTGKSQRYGAYIAEFKGQPNNIKLKSGGGTDQLGYVEFTGAGWAQGVQHGRIVYNYYEDLAYFTFHYQTEFFGTENNPFLFVNYRLGRGLVAPGVEAKTSAVPWALSGFRG